MPTALSFLYYQSGMRLARGCEGFIFCQHDAAAKWMIRDVKEGTREPYRGGKALLRDGYGGISSLCGDFPPQIVAGFLLGLYVMMIGGFIPGAVIMWWSASMMNDIHTGVAAGTEDWYD